MNVFCFVCFSSISTNQSWAKLLRFLFQIVKICSSCQILISYIFRTCLLNSQIILAVIAGLLEAAYSLNWGAQKIWGKGGGGDLGTFMISRPI